MTTVVGKEAAQLNSNSSTGQEPENVPEPFNYRQFSKALNRSRYLDELKLRDK